jgi:DNA processing protein
MTEARRRSAEVLLGEKLPPRLADLEAPPARLYLHGELPRGPAVALVGTRKASAEGLAFTRKLAAELAAAGVAVLSGGAEGIDTAAHEGALDVGGVTVVVTPAGFDRPFPKQNAELFERVVSSGGAYLSLFPDGAPADRPTFFARNACLVALAHVVVVTQAPYVSGAANAAKWARQLGRPLFVVPHSPWVTAGAGAIRELRRGALPLDRAKEVLTLLSALGLHPLRGPIQGELWPAAPLGDHAPPGKAAPAGSAAPSDDDPVLAALKSGACYPDEICEQTGLSLATVQQRILTLALSGVLVPGPLGSLKPVNC